MNQEQTASGKTMVNEPSDEVVDAFVERILRLTDDDRLVIADARAAVDETFHDRSLRAAAEALSGRGETYVGARIRLALAHVPEALRDDRAAGVRWLEVARLVQLAIDEMLAAFVARDALHPDHLRELSRPWQALPAV